MADPDNPAAAVSGAELTLTITRTLDAPREAVFKAWTDPAQIARWIGPRSIKAQVEKMDARPGGAYRILMHGPSGAVHIVGGVYREIAPPERLVFTWAWENDGPGISAGHETVVTITFTAVGGKTEMRLRHERLANQESRDSHDHGWAGSFDKLADLLGRPPGGV